MRQFLDLAKFQVLDKLFLIAIITSLILMLQMIHLTCSATGCNTVLYTFIKT